MPDNFKTIKSTKKGWTKQPNAILRDKDLTSDAKIVIFFLLSITKNYTISIRGISKTINLSESKVRRATTLLQRTGYLKIEKVKVGKIFGYKWLISDAPGVYGEYTDGHSIDGTSMDGHSIDEQTIDGTSMGAHIYEYTERYEQTKDERPKDEGQKRVKSETLTLTPISPSGESIISQQELNITQAFNRFCEVYPNLGDIDQARAAFFAIPDIGNICHQIVNSVAWFERRKRWDDWKTGQKNVSCPGAIRFLKEGHWKQYLKSGATVSEEERIMAALNRSRQNNNSIFGGAEYGTN